MVAEQKPSAGGHPPTLLGGTAIKPVERHGFEAIRYLIYNPDTGEVFTRTPKSWFLIFVFYCIYYTCLAAFWLGMLNLFFLTLPIERPKYVMDAAIIGNNPGVGLRPQQYDKKIDSAMLFLKANAKNETPSEFFETSSNIDWAKRYEKYLQKYDNLNDTRECGDDVAGDKGKDACIFDIAPLEECAKFPYGYQVAEGKTQIEPCILLKINRIFDWMPEPFEESDLEEDDPEDPIPEPIKAKIRENPKQIYIDCQGENPADKDALVGKMKYLPSSQAISYKYFPYNHAHKNYHNALVAVKFSDLPLGQLLHIECKLWAKGIRHVRKDRVGQVHFELILE